LKIREAFFPELKYLNLGNSFSRNGVNITAPAVAYLGSFVHIIIIIIISIFSSSFYATGLLLTTGKVKRGSVNK